MLEYHHGPKWQPRPGTSSWPLVVIWPMNIDTDPYCCTAIDPAMALPSITGQDFTVASGGITGYSHLAVPFHPHVSRLSLHSTQICPLSLPSLYPILTHCSGLCYMDGPHSWQATQHTGPMDVFQCLSNPKDSKGNKLLAKVKHSTVKL